MEKEFFFAVISALLTTSANIFYFRDIIRGRSYPHPISFGVWTILVGFNTYVLVISKDYIGALPNIIFTINQIVFLGFGIYYRKKVSYNWFDWFCLVLILLLIGYWIISQNILNTVILTLIIDVIAFLPTFKKGWLFPWSETIIAYFVPGITQIFTLLAISSLTLENSLFWIYLLFANLTFFFMVFLRRWYLKGWNSIFE